MRRRRWRSRVWDASNHRVSSVEAWVWSGERVAIRSACIPTYTGLEMIEGIRFLWNATRGERLRPWRSRYLRWRMETYSGKWAESIEWRDFWEMFWKEKRQVMRFLRWTGEMKGYAEPERRE